MFTDAIVPVDESVWDVVRTPADKTVRNSPVTAIAITAPMDIVRVGMLFSPYLKSEVSSINKPYCPPELHNYTTVNTQNNKNQLKTGADCHFPASSYSVVSLSAAKVCRN
jgi:hypothetical protein